MILVNKDSQTDTFGFNVVDEFLDFVYTKVNEGKLELWDSPRKVSKINFLALQEIENSSGSSFTGSHNFFIYELWSSGRRKTNFDIAGFAFVSVNSKGEDVSFGYLDYTDVANLLKTYYVKPCIDCIYKLSFYDVFMNKMFKFDILYFNDKLIINEHSKHPEKAYLKSLKIKNKAFGEGVTNSNATRVSNSKLITYFIVKTDYNKGSAAIFESLEEYFGLHRRELLNYGGKSFIQDFRETEVVFTQCYFTELWTKKNGVIKSELVSFEPVSFGNKFNHPITPELIDSMGIRIKEMDFEKYLGIKDFTYHLKSINNIEIDNSMQSLLLEAILSQEWNKISEFIKSY